MKITINGVPAPQGSKRHVGNGRMVESSKAVGPWREAVRAETQRALADHAPFHEGAVWVEITFRLPRPKGHHGAKGLRPSAPRHPAVKPDLDKLARAVLDGVVSGGALRDDAQVSVLSVEKVYADEAQPGAVVRIGGDVVSTYADFLARKVALPAADQLDTTPADVHPFLHDWQAEIVAWACRTGRAAVWADTGLGKTVMQLEWARIVADTSLIVAPLAVTAQTVREARKLGIEAHYVRHGSDITGPGVWVTNYEMVEHFDPATLDAVVLDEASILKQSDGKTRTRMIRHFAEVPYRLACTATPAPNDIEELTNQAEFLGVSTRVNMLSAYFVHDSDGWRMKGHARRPMFRWMTSWAVALRSPADLGYDDADYILPGLDIRSHLLDVDATPEGQLFATDLGGVGGRAAVRRATMQARCERAAALVDAEPTEPWLVWCGLNDEADLLARLIPGSVNVHGSWSPEDKAAALLDFADGGIRVLITKPSIAAFGLNWQHCARMVFVGLSDSYEAYYQSIRRCYRYGQTRVVEAHIVLSELEGQIASNVARKEREASHITSGLVAEMRAAGELGRTA